MQIRYRFSLFALLAGITLAALALVVSRGLFFELSLARLDRQICDLKAGDFVRDHHGPYVIIEYPHLDANIRNLFDRRAAFRRLFPRLDDASPISQRRAAYVLRQLAKNDASLQEQLRQKLARLETEDSDLKFEIQLAQ